MAERFLIIGLGSIGRRHARLLRELRPKARLAALRSSGADDLDTNLIDEQFASWEEALAYKPTAAIVSNPAPFHRDAAERLFAAAVPALIEKPLAADFVDAKAIAGSHAAAGVTAMVGYSLRFHPLIEQVRKLILEEVGDIRFIRAEVGQYLPDWRPGADYRQAVSARRELGGGALLELSHEIDLVQSFLGPPAKVTAVTGTVSDLEIDVEDVAELAFMDAQGALNASIHVDFLSRKAFRRLLIVGTKATLSWDILSDKIELGRSSEAAWTDMSLAAPRERDDIYRNELTHFLDAVKAGEVSPFPSLKDAAEVVRTIAMARRSAKTGAIQSRVSFADEKEPIL